jgi:NAD(P)-dependent dehydrogenase (short-subunit alcohol dehydrogenase family)
MQRRGGGGVKPAGAVAALTARRPARKVGANERLFVSRGAGPGAGTGRVRRVRLAGRVALVTGAGSGIGRATARALAAEGARVVVADVDGDAARAVAAELADAVAVAGDVAADADARALAGAARDRYGALHVLVNNAGVDLPGARSVTETSEADWQRTFSVNVTGVFLVSRAALPLMLASGGGSVVNVASVAGLVGVPAEAAYGASKGAVIALSRQMAVDYAPAVRVNAVCPGMVERPTRDRAAALDQAGLDRRAAWAAAQPLGRAATHEEVAAAILFLAGDGAAFVTGTALVVDGGMVAR